MPATLVAPHAAPEVSAASLVSVENLSNGERMVALYASDMPDRFRYQRGDTAKLVAWVVQGAARLGLDELYRSAAYAHSYRLLWLTKMATEEQTRAHTDRFANARRLDRAESAAATLLCGPDRIDVAPSAVVRSRRSMVEGACYCEGAGWLPYDMGDGTYALTACPGHNPDGTMPTPSAVIS
ncbi:hypothetical protein OG292_20780 [Streptomyces sp. NBC_01511]|uniref:hypothetical protein n=1 Tax=unclassified Streptomyces TaxID=2593676 RepID=UPI00386DFBAD